MPGLAPKKMLILNILEILKRHTDEDHPLTQKQIMDYLDRDDGMAVDRKAVKRNLAELMDAGYPVRTGSERTRSRVDTVTGDTDENIMYSDFYYEHEFSNGELRFLIDSLLFSKSIPSVQRKQLMKKLEGLSSEHFHAHVRHIHSAPRNQPENRQLFYTIEILDEAISKGKQVELTCCSYGTDKKLHPHPDNAGNISRQLVNPYQIVAANGRYYLVCNVDKYDNVAHYRVDRIADICLMNTAAKPKDQVKGLEHGLNLPKHMAEHLYMFPGESVRVKFRAKKYLLNDLMDWFGTDAEFSNETENTVDVSVTVNQIAMEMWAMQYARHVEVLEPNELRLKVKEDLIIAYRSYCSD